MPVTASLVAGATSVVNNTVTNLMQQPLQKAKINSLQLQDRLSQLTNQQQQVLALKLQAAQTQDQQMQILTDAVSQIDVATVSGNASILAASVGSQSSNSLVTAGIIFASMAALLFAYYFINKKD